MPADADLLCEYYITSNLGKKVTLSTSSSLLAGSNKATKKDTDTSERRETNKRSLSESNEIKGNFFEYIKFVKYEKSPMDYLKSKYTLLNANAHSDSRLTNTASINSTSVATEAISTGNSLWKASTPVSTEVNSLKGISTSMTMNMNATQQTSSERQFKNSQWLQQNWSKIRKIGIGLLNLGNNCYLNATLQCLAYTPAFSQWLIGRPHSPLCRFKQIKGFCSLCEVELIINEIFSSCSGFAKPNALCFNIKSK
jgi:hypothetical protein